MNRHVQVALCLVVVAIVSVMMLAQSPAFAQSVDRQGEAASPTLARSFALFGGSFQEADTGSDICTGQCLFPNIFTNSCACAGGYTEVPAARILVDVDQGVNVLECGSTLVFCLR
jgi:hypothetical protein